MKSSTAILLSVVFIIGVFVLLRSRPSPGATAPARGGNVSVVDGTQIVTIRAKGGYTPGTSGVKAGIPTILRFQTDSTFDCSSTVRIPSLGVDKNLPPNGTTDIALGSLQPGTLRGTCGMGMYQFSLDAKS